MKNVIDKDETEKPTSTENSFTDTEMTEITPQEKYHEMPELNLERIIKYLSQNNLPLNLEHIALKNENSTEEKTLIDLKLESPKGEKRLEKMMNNEKTKEKKIGREKLKSKDTEGLLDKNCKKG